MGTNLTGKGLSLYSVKNHIASYNSRIAFCRESTDAVLVRVFKIRAGWARQ